MGKNMKKQVFNPFLPSWEYIPDGEPHVFGERLFLFGSHDRFNGTTFCMNDYVCWSCPVNDLSDWQYHGIIYRKMQDPFAKSDSIMQAPDVVKGFDGRYYLYYALGMIPFVSVAVSERPEGPYEYYGVVHRVDGTPVGTGRNDVFMFDPGLFMDDNRKLYLYCGFGPEETGIFADACKKYRLDGAYVSELEQDMLTIKTEPEKILPKVGFSSGTGFEGHEFYEGSSMRKINGIYYFIYSSILSHELCYATSKFPDRDFSFKGTLVSNGDIGIYDEAKNYMGNTHGSIANINGQWYVFYHRQTNRHQYSRQACAEKINFINGEFLQASLTSCGLNGKPLSGDDEYDANIACHLSSQNGSLFYDVSGTPGADLHPYFTQTGNDREGLPDQYIANMHSGAWASFRFFSLERTNEIGICVSGTGNGRFIVSNEDSGKEICVIPVSLNTDKKWFFSQIVPQEGQTPLCFKFFGSGIANFHKLRLKSNQSNK